MWRGNINKPFGSFEIIMGNLQYESKTITKRISNKISHSIFLEALRKFLSSSGKRFFLYLVARRDAQPMEQGCTVASLRVGGPALLASRALGKLSPAPRDCSSLSCRSLTNNTQAQSRGNCPVCDRARLLLCYLYAKHETALCKT